jgi:hypothetical protein
VTDQSETGRRQEVQPFGGKTVRTRLVRTAGILLSVAGAALLAVSLLADVVGLGDSTRFGPNQVTGTIVGGVVLVVGLLLVLWGSRRQATS